MDEATRHASSEDLLALRLEGNPFDATSAALRGLGARGDPHALTLSGRVGALAAVLVADGGRADVWLPLVCAEPGCGEALEVTLPLDRMIDLADEAEASPVVAAVLSGGRQVRIRRPTGADVRAWRRGGLAGAEEGSRAVAAALLIESRPGEGGHDPIDLDAVAESLAERMEEADPLAAFRVRTQCPECGAALDHPVDLEAVLVDEIRSLRDALVADVHRLATHYGWSEAEVLAVPEWRRADYLARIDTDQGW